MRHLWILAVLTVIAAPQLRGQHTPSPYAGREAREIKALSPEEIKRYEAGEGMGLALVGELNHYPGPRHVLEWADTLGIDPERRDRIRTIGEVMGREAQRLGRLIVQHERALDRAFAGRTVAEATLRSAIMDIARLNGELRFVHLRAHLEVTTLLSLAQIRLYDVLRGYGGNADHSVHH